MSTASSFLTSLYSAKGLSHCNIKHQSLTQTESLSLEFALKHDASRYFYSSAVTFASAISSLQNSHGTWATIQMYYSVFYSLRSWLASENRCLFYYQRKAFLLESAPLSAPVRKDGPSHDIVIREFRRVFPTDDVVVGVIDVEPALAWLKSKRETVNYQIERFPDPEWAGHLKMLRSHGIRRLCEQYLKDRSYDWRFDPDHAIIALPLDLIFRLRSRLDSKNVAIELTPGEKAFLRRGVKDSNGPLNSVCDLFEPQEPM